MSDTQTFDPDTFMNQHVDAPMATDFKLVPEGFFQAMIDNWEDNSKVFFHGEKDGKRWVRANIPVLIQDPAVIAEMGRDKVYTRISTFLDFDDNGALSTAPDRNVLLGRLRAALGQNSGPWNFQMLKGQGPIMVQVKHRADKENPEKKYAEVVNVAPVR